MRPKRFPHRQLAAFNRMLASAVERGIPLHRALDVIAAQGPSRRFRTTLDRISGSVREGTSLPDAVRRAPRSFPEEYPAFLEAGIQGGDLPGVLRQMEQYHSMCARLSQGTSRMMAYTGACLLLCLVVFGVVGVFWSKFLVYRNIQEMYLWMIYWRDPPVHLNLMKWLTEDFYRLPLILLALALLLWVGIPGVLRGTLGRTRLGYWVPAWGRLQKNRDLGLFCVSMALRLRTGAPLPEALRLAGEAVPTRYTRKALREVRLLVAEGLELSNALFIAKPIPRTLCWGVSIGESRGDVADTFRLFGDLYTSDLEQSFDLVLILITPLGLFLVGNVVLLMAMMFMAPWFF